MAAHNARKLTNLFGARGAGRQEKGGCIRERGIRGKGRGRRRKEEEEGKERRTGRRGKGR